MYRHNMEKNKGYDATYWSSKGKYQKDYDRLFAKLVPARDKASTPEGELLRCISRFYYDRYNNGHCNDLNYEKEFVNKFLRKRKDAPVKRIAYKMLDKELDLVVDYIIEYLVNQES